MVKVKGVVVPGLPSAFTAAVAATEREAASWAAVSPRTAKNGTESGNTIAPICSLIVPRPALSTGPPVSKSMKLPDGVKTTQYLVLA